MLYRLIRSFLGPYRKTLLVVVALQFAQVVALLLLPTLNAEIIDDGVAEGETGTILRLGGVMLVVALVQVAAAVTAVFYGSRTAMAVARDIRAALYHRVETFSSQEMSRFGTPSL